MNTIDKLRQELCFKGSVCKQAKQPGVRIVNAKWECGISRCCEGDETVNLVISGYGDLHFPN